MSRASDFIDDKSWMGEKGRPDDTDFRNAIEIIEGLQTEIEETRWIPVGERLPEKGVTCYIFMPEINNFTTFKGHCHQPSGTWATNLKSYSMTKKVTHWRPITLPPE